MLIEALNNLKKNILKLNILECRVEHKNLSNSALLKLESLENNDNLELEIYNING
jgi:hypothetical protein